MKFIKTFSFLTRILFVYNKRSTNIDYAWQGTEIIAQFDYFINLLERERNEENEKRVYDGITEKIIRKWHDLVKDRGLFFDHGLCVRPKSKCKNGTIL